MSDPKRQLRRILDRYRSRAAAISLEMPELKALAERHAEGRAALAEAPAPVPQAPAPAPVAERAPEISTPLPPRWEPAPEEFVEQFDEEASAARPWLAVVLVAAVAGGAWLAAGRLMHRNAHSVVPLPLSSPAALARRGGALFTFDRAKGQLAIVDAAAGTLISSKRFPIRATSGLAAASDRLWSADPNGFVYEHSLEDGYPVRRTFANPERRPSALHWDGSHLWIADARTNSLYEYSVGESLAPARQFTLPPGVKATGLHVEDGVVWVLDAAARRIHRFRARSLLEPVDSAALDEWIPAESKPAGMLVGGRTVWIATDGPPELHRFDARRLPWRADL